MCFAKVKTTFETFYSTEYSEGNSVGCLYLRALRTGVISFEDPLSHSRISHTKGDEFNGCWLAMSGSYHLGQMRDTLPLFLCIDVCSYLFFFLSGFLPPVTIDRIGIRQACP